MKHWQRAVLTSALVACAGLLAGGDPAAARAARVYGNVDGARIAAADSEPGNPHLDEHELQLHRL